MKVTHVSSQVTEGSSVDSGGLSASISTCEDGFELFFV